MIKKQAKAPPRRGSVNVAQDQAVWNRADAKEALKRGLQEAKMRASADSANKARPIKPKPGTTQKDPDATESDQDQTATESDSDA